MDEEHLAIPSLLAVSALNSIWCARRKRRRYRSC
ncbi:MAG: hypothetical protein ACLVJ6_00430 [Merdibacter sp.]